MTGLAKNARFTLRSHVTYRPVDQGALLVDLNSGSCFRLNEVGTLLWTSLAGGGTIESAMSSIRGRYDVPIDVVEVDSLRLCRELLEAGLVELNADESPSQEPVVHEQSKTR